LDSNRFEATLGSTNNDANGSSHNRTFSAPEHHTIFIPERAPDAAAIARAIARVRRQKFNLSREYVRCGRRRVAGRMVRGAPAK